MTPGLTAGVVYFSRREDFLGEDERQLKTHYFPPGSMFKVECKETEIVPVDSGTDNTTTVRHTTISLVHSKKRMEGPSVDTIYEEE